MNDLNYDIITVGKNREENKMSMYRQDADGTLRDFWTGEIVDPFSGSNEQARMTQTPVRTVSAKDMERIRNQILRDRMGL